MANDGGVSKKLAGAKAALEGAYNSNVSAPRPAAPAPNQEGAGHAIGVGFAKAHGSNHQGIASEAQSAGEGIAANARNAKAVEEN